MKGLHWFRTGLRLHDNPALVKAAERCSSLLPVYAMDPSYWTQASANRVSFLLDSLRALDSGLQERGSRLQFVRGDPVEVVLKLVEEHGVNLVSFERSTEPHHREVENRLVEGCRSRGVEVLSIWGHTLYDPEYLLTHANGNAPLTMRAFQKLLEQAGEPNKPIPSPASLPPPPGSKGGEIPSLNELGYTDSYTSWFKAGEEEAMKSLREFMAQKSRVVKFEKPKTLPTSLEPDTTALSPYVSNGCLSVRVFYYQLKSVLKDTKHTAPPVSLVGQLYWREMAYLIGYSSPNFHQMRDNPLCRQISWREEGIEGDLTRWEESRTGYPAVDAAMAQLRLEGWMHHLARHLVACFLTRGDLWITWEAGRDVFERYLLDADWSINNFSWHWLSCSAFFSAYYRVYSPVVFFKKSDPSGEYIRKYLPALAKFPNQYIYEPWSAPIAVQREAGCIIGEDYPRPIVDHGSASKENMDKMKAAFGANRAEKGAKKQTKLNLSGPAAKKIKPG